MVRAVGARDRAVPPLRAAVATHAEAQQGCPVRVPQFPQAVSAESAAEQECRAPVAASGVARVTEPAEQERVQLEAREAGREAAPQARGLPVAARNHQAVGATR